MSGKSSKRNMNSILREASLLISPSKEEMKNMKLKIKELSDILKKKIKSMNLDAEVFIGGSFAKNTVIKKQHYDADIFIRFSNKYEDKNLPILTKKLLSGKKYEVIHGSRDYFKINLFENFSIEIIPVIKIKNPNEARNITDLSYAHVKYIRKKLKSEKLLNDVKLAKAFCHAKKCYGAESYIKGFSGYALELLILHYGSFLKFIKAMSKIDPKGKEIIDIEKHFKSKQEVLRNLNSSKLQSPIVLIDPTYKQRNALAALSEETLKRFKKECIKFLKKPSLKEFFPQKTDINKIKSAAKRKNLEFVLIRAVTEKQEGDIAGSKLLKFYNNLCLEISRFFIIKFGEFEYPSGDGKTAHYILVVKPRKEVVYEGPLSVDMANAERFKRKHKDVFEKSGRLYAREKVSFNIKDFIDSWKHNNKKKMNEMSIQAMSVIDSTTE